METSSKEIISYLKDNLNKDNYVSMFVAGSRPEILKVQSDLDIFIIIKDSNRNALFSNLIEIMNNFIKDRKILTYSFLKGPIKYKSKGLIHFLIYTDKITENKDEKEPWMNEHLSVIKKLIPSAKLIYGETPSSITKIFDLSDGKVEDDKKHFEEKYNTLKETGIIKYREWKNKKGWQLVQLTIKPKGFYKDYLIKYFEKNLN